MTDLFSRFLTEEKIDLFAVLPFSQCTQINRPLLERTLPDAKTVILMLFPYYAGDSADRNISLYAVPKDYHLFARTLYERLCGKMKEAYPEYSFAGFSDHSPIDERDAAVKCGLGVIGDNGLLISKRYGSYLFLGEILTDMPFEGEFIPKTNPGCLHCGACRAACPMKDECLSAITQKKGELTEEEIGMMLSHGSAWGCDLCQLPCPMNEGIEETPISFFREDRITHLTSEAVEAMSKEEFASRAFAWRGKKTVLRNLKLFEEK